MNVSFIWAGFLSTVADQLERTPGKLRKTLNLISFKFHLISLHMDEIHWVPSSRSHSKHGDICGVSSLTYPEMTSLFQLEIDAAPKSAPEMTQLFWGRKFPAKHHELSTTNPFTWHFIPLCWPKPHL